MRMFKKSLAIILAVVMAISCISVASAANKATSDSAKLPETPKGFKSAAFKEQNSYQYADDELVRAIIVMDGEASANVAENGTTRAASNSLKLAKQHQGLMQKMTSKKISYNVGYEYTELLNGIAVDVAYGDLEAISNMDGVNSVYIANHYDQPHYDVKMESSNEMTGLAMAHQSGILGSGMVIAVLDTGMSAGHEAFQVYDGMLEDAALSEDAAKAFISDCGHGTYVSEKIPFSYDYADNDNDAEDSTNGHGPHVSGIAAGYAEAEDGAITFMGAAPDAQLLELKIFMDDQPGTDSSIYFAALEDAYKLNADVINMSIGAPSGFTYEPELDEVLDNIYQTLENAGIVCCISAGNENSMAAYATNWAGDGYVTSDYADYGLVGSPATYDGNMAIASLENAAYPTYVLNAGGMDIPYYDADENFQFYNAMKGLEANFVDCGYGYVEDFADVDVEGKVALMSRGDITFQEKVDNAAAAGACAALVYNNTDGIIYMSIDPYKIPAASLTQEDGLALLALLEAGDSGMKAVRSAQKPDMRGEDDITAYYTAMPEDGDPVVLYSAKDGVIMAYSAESEEDGDYVTAWNQNTELATVEGSKLTASWDDAGILYAVDMEDGTWAFVDQYYYDYYDEMYLLYNDGTFVGTIGETSDDEVYYELVPSGDGYLFLNEASERYLTIKDGMLYDTAKATEATVFSFYVLDDEGGDGPVVEPIVDPDAPIMKFLEEMVVVGNADGWLMSDFSSWGCTPSLTLKPTITGVGGDVSSAEFNTEDGYVVYSGTSMAAPDVTGYMAVLLSALKEKETSTVKPCASKEYSDVDQTKWYHEAVDYVISEDYMGSTKKDDLTFEPNTKVSRAMVASIMYRICGTPAVSYSGAFPDVPNGMWFTNAVEFAAQNGLASGKSGGKFDPNGNVTRQELAVFMYNLAKYLGRDVSGKADLSTFADAASIPGWSKDYLAWAVDAGIISGQASGGKVSLNPVAGAMRSEFASIIMRFMGGSYKEGEVVDTKAERAEKAEAIAQSTAMVIIDAEEYPYSPRKQGSGLIDIVSALKTDAYIEEPIQNLFDNEDGVFAFTFKVINDGEEAIEYAVDPVVMYDYPASENWGDEEDPDIRWYNSLTADCLIDGEDCEIDAPETVTVAAGQSAEVTVKITLTEATKELLAEIYPNGNFIEGYVFLTPADEEAIEIHATYMGFFGDWTKAPVMEQHDWREIVDAENFVNTEDYDGEGNTYADYGYTALDCVDFEVNSDISIAYALNYSYLEAGELLGGYAGDNLFAYADFNEKHIAISEGEDGICDTLYMMPMNLRNARHMIMVVSDAKTGEVYYVDDTEYLPRSTYDEEYGYWANSGLFMYDGTDAKGNVLPSGTVVDISYYCNIAYGEDVLGAIDYANMKAEAADYLEWNFLCTIDNDAPEFTYEYNEAAKTLTVTATDNQYLAAVSLYIGDELFAKKSFSDDEAGLTHTVVFEDVPTDAVYELDVCDYATNIASEDVICGNVPMATVKFVFPEDCELSDYEAEYTTYVGNTLNMPDVFGDIEGGYMAAWVNTPFEDVISSDDLYEDEYAFIWDEMLFAGDEYEVTGDVTFYVLAERVTEYYDVHEELACCMSNQADWSGKWAFDGYDWTVEDEEDIYDYVLSSDLSTFALTYDNEDEYVTYGFFGDGYLCGAKDAHLFEIEMTGVDDDGFGVYTIKASNGKYVAITADGKLTLTNDASSAYATWDIWFDGDVACNIVYNRGADYVLLFNQETRTFSAVSADDAQLDEPYNLYMYGLSAIDYEYYIAK